jgi:hypothetical protein
MLPTVHQLQASAPRQRQPQPLTPSPLQHHCRSAALLLLLHRICPPCCLQLLLLLRLRLVLRRSQTLLGCGFLQAHSNT